MLRISQNTNSQAFFVSARDYKKNFSGKSPDQKAKNMNFFQFFPLAFSSRLGLGLGFRLGFRLGLGFGLGFWLGFRLGFGFDSDWISFRSTYIK